MHGGIHIYDLLLTVAILSAAWKALFSRQPFKASMFFISCGLILALIWVRLSAIDVALAEGAIGAGLTGALLMGSLRHFANDSDIAKANPFDSKSFIVGLFSLLLTGTLVSILLHLGEPGGEGIIPHVARELPNSGSTHPVTAVLLNFRAFDTWLELGVLLLAAIAGLSVERMQALHDPELKDQPNAPLLHLARATLPLLLIIGGVVLWLGSRSPGGAFQAGALIGAAGIFMQLAGLNSFFSRFSRSVRLMLALGFFVFLIVGISCSIFSGSFLQYPPDFAGSLILVMELAAMLSIATTLNVMYYVTVGEQGGGT